MRENEKSEPEHMTHARFLRARTALEGHDETQIVLLDFEMEDVDPELTRIAMACSLDNTRKLVHSCLAALASFGDQPASVLLKMLNQNRAAPHASN